MSNVIELCTITVPRSYQLAKNMSRTDSDKPVDKLLAEWQARDMSEQDGRDWKDIPEGTEHIGERLGFIVRYRKTNDHALGVLAKLKNPRHVAMIRKGNVGKGVNIDTIRAITDVAGFDFTWVALGRGQPFASGLLNHQIPGWTEMEKRAAERYPAIPTPAFVGARQLRSTLGERELTPLYAAEQAQLWQLLSAEDVMERERAERINATGSSEKTLQKNNPAKPPPPRRSSGTRGAVRVEPTQPVKKSRGS